MAKYSFKIPHNRGITQVNVQNLNIQQVSVQQNNIVGDLNDMFLHLLFGRIALSNNEVYELETKYDGGTNTLELNVSEEILSKIINTKIGNNLKTFMNWIANVNEQSLSDESDSSRSTGSSYSSESLSSSDSSGSSDSSESSESDSSISNSSQSLESLSTNSSTFSLSSSTSSKSLSSESISISSESSSSDLSVLSSSSSSISILTNSSLTSSTSTSLSLSTQTSSTLSSSTSSSFTSSSESSIVYPKLLPDPIITNVNTTLTYTRYARVLCKTGASTLTFWSSPSEGDEIFVVNENGSTLTINPNGSTSKLTLLYNDESARFVFMDGRWIV